MERKKNKKSEVWRLQIVVQCHVRGTRLLAIFGLVYCLCTRAEQKKKTGNNSQLETETVAESVQNSVMCC